MASFDLFLAGVFVLNLLGVVLYKRIAIAKKILANPNFRTLHQLPIPRGGGIVFASIASASFCYLWFANELEDELFVLLGVCGYTAALFGFFDDVYDISAKKKLAIQFLLSIFAVFLIKSQGLFGFEGVPGFIAIPLSVLFLIWVMNAYNFMDGVDGMAASGAILASGLIALSIILSGRDSEVLAPLLVLAISVLAFLVFNWAPAKIFMGDSGSVFLGYVFGVLILVTTARHEISIWTWIIVFGYFIADTTVTQIARIVLVKKWYVAHRSHAYQNFARIHNSHLRITMGVILYSLLWLTPLAIWSVFAPDMAVLFAVLALSPALVFSYKYGPVLSTS